jgi:hypothetical protein
MDEFEETATHISSNHNNMDADGSLIPLTISAAFSSVSQSVMASALISVSKCVGRSRNHTIYLDQITVRRLTMDEKGMIIM